MLIFGAEDGMRTRSADPVELLIGGDHANIKRLPKRPTHLGRMMCRPIAPLIALAARSKSEFRVSESVRFDSPMPFELSMKLARDREDMGAWPLLLVAQTYSWIRPRSSTMRRW
jgi:hypothetical protein